VHREDLSSAPAHVAAESGLGHQSRGSNPSSIMSRSKELVLPVASIPTRTLMLRRF